MSQLFRKRIRRLAGDARGATAIEYGVMLAALAIGLIGAMNQLGSGQHDLFGVVNNAMPDT